MYLCTDKAGFTRVWDSMYVSWPSMTRNPVSQWKIRCSPAPQLWAHDASGVTRRSGCGAQARRPAQAADNAAGSGANYR